MNEKLMRRQLREARQEIAILPHPEYQGAVLDAGRKVRDALSKTMQCRK